MDDQTQSHNSLRLLIVDCNSAKANDRMTALGGMELGAGYARAFSRIRPDIHCTIVQPAEQGTDCLPHGAALSDFDGIVLTGSAYSVYDDRPQIRDQIQLVKRTLPIGKPVLGSCYGIQVMSAALGGTVRANPKGLEAGLARNITANDAGRAHPLFADRPGPFNAVAMHGDEVETPPADAVVLASNGMSAVQAMEVRRGDSVYWGVQYHPEFDFDEIAPIIRLRAGMLVEKGLFSDEESALDFAENLENLGHPKAAAAAAAALGLPMDFTDLGGRLRELKLWLDHLVVPNAALNR